jgi:cyclopropane fatty-acyl-phospholipid synthase-like methyltransferase
MMPPKSIISEDFDAVSALYDHAMPENNTVHDMIYPNVFGPGEYIGQFSDNSASELKTLASMLALGPEAQVLDIGCGTCAIASFFVSEQGWKITGIDVAATSLVKARRRLIDDNRGDQISIVHGNVYTHAFDQVFDGIYGTGAFCHFDAFHLFSRCHALLVPGGRLGFLERVRTDVLTSNEWKQLTEEWACPSVYTVEEYETALNAAKFDVLNVLDLTETFRLWQERSVSVRYEMREEIVARTSEQYWEISTALADRENQATKRGKLGYALVVARAL